MRGCFRILLDMDNDRVIQIEDADDPRLALYRNLRDGQPLAGQNVFFAEGRLIVRRMIESGQAIHSLLVQQGKEAEFLPPLSADVPVYSLPQDLIATLTGYNFHRGVLGCGQRPRDERIESLSFAENDVPIALTILGVSDQENLGSMLRSAAAFGIRHIVIGPRTINPFRRRVIRVSMAAVFVHRFYRMRDPINDLNLFHEQGFCSVATTLQDAIDAEDFQRDDRPLLLMVGSEADGIPLNIQAMATERVRIPMQLGTDSLNVAVAAAIMMYQLARP